MRIRTFLTALAAVVLLPVTAWAAARSGQPAPGFLLPSSTGGANVSLDAFKGKPVYLNFFASWCGPCNDEAPSIGKLRARYAKQGLRVVGIDYLEDAGPGAAFAKKFGNPYSLVVHDDSGAVSRAYGVFGLPAHVFIDRNGVVKLVHPGEMNPAEIEAAIKDVVK